MAGGKRNNRRRGDDGDSANGDAPATPPQEQQQQQQPAAATEPEARSPAPAGGSTPRRERKPRGKRAGSATPPDESSETAPLVVAHSAADRAEEPNGVYVGVDADSRAMAARKSPSPNKPGGGGEEPNYSVGHMFHLVFAEKWQLKLLLIAVPIALLGDGMGVSTDILFFASFLGLVPLAGLLGDFTEDLALRSNDVIGALINVTFGNATELIISIMALRAGMLDVIKLSLIGSVLGNMLLVLGTAFVVGGLKHKDMTFNTHAVNTYGPLLQLTLLGFVIPSVYWSAHGALGGKKHDSEVVLAVSRQVAVVMAAAYCAYLYFQLFTHKHLFDAVTPKKIAGEPVEDDDDEEEEVPVFTFVFALVGLAIVSVLISVLSDILVATLQDAAVKWHIPEQFIGIILVPIVGNAAEHASAIFMAAKNKLDISVGVALGSSIQIALFVIPVLVISGWFVGVPLNMNFHPFLTATTVMSVLVVNNVVGDGETNWLEGFMLICAYVMVALVFLNGTIQMD